MCFRALPRDVAPHLGQQRRVPPGRRGLRQQRIELVELVLRCVAVCKSGGTFELPDERIKSAVGVLGRAEKAQQAVRCGLYPLAEFGDQPGLADAGLAAQQDQLAFAGCDAVPAVDQRFRFRLTARQRDDFFPTDREKYTSTPKIDPRA